MHERARAQCSKAGPPGDIDLPEYREIKGVEVTNLGPIIQLCASFQEEKTTSVVPIKTRLYLDLALSIRLNHFRAPRLGALPKNFLESLTVNVMIFFT